MSRGKIEKQKVENSYFKAPVVVFKIPKKQEELLKKAVIFGETIISLTRHSPFCQCRKKVIENENMYKLFINFLYLTIIKKEKRWKFKNERY